MTNNGYVTVTMFPSDKPEMAKQIELGAIGPRGLRLIQRVLSGLVTTILWATH